MRLLISYNVLTENYLTKYRPPTCTHLEQIFVRCRVQFEWISRRRQMPHGMITDCIGC